MTREDELFEKLNNGEHSALDELIEMYYPDILRYCMWHTPDRQTAEDATQETFLKAVRHIDSYAHRGKFKAFLYKIAANTCTDLWRQSSRQHSLESEEYIEQGFENAEADESLRMLVDALPKDQQELIILRYVDALKLREIADITGQPLRTVQSQLRTALKALEKTLVKGEMNNE